MTRKDPVSPQVHAEVIVRDRGCVLAGRIPNHVCRTVFGDMHPWNDVEKLTLEHVKSELAMGKRAPSKVQYLVLLDGFTNNKPPSKEERAVMRAYLSDMYPEAWS